MNQKKQAKVLLVEDHLDTAKLYKRMLEVQGFEVEMAHDGVAALEKIREGGYSLILLDVRLPKLDGIGVLKKLKEKPAKVKSGSIVMLTNVGDESVVRKAMSLGAMSYMDKTNLDPEHLVAKVEGVLGLVDA